MFADRPMEPMAEQFAATLGLAQVQIGRIEALRSAAAKQHKWGG